MFISGIASGIDTEKIIEQIMAIERRPLVLMQQRKNLLQQQRDAWRDINSRLNNLRERMADLSRVDLYGRRSATSSVTDVATVTASNAAAEARYTINVTELARAHRVRSDQFTDSPNISGTAWIGIGDVGEVAEGRGAFIDFLATDSLTDIAEKINDANAGVTARVIDGHLVIEAAETGASNVIKFQDDVGGGVWQQLGVAVDDGLGGLVAKHELQAAQDAVFEVDGISITRSSNTIDDLIEGVTIRLHGQGQAVIEVEQDADAVVDAVRRFVEQYNSAVSFMAEKSGEDAVLQGDTLLMRIQVQLRSDTTAPVAAGPDALYNQLASVGVTVDRYGRMSLDEDRLREVLAENPQDVQRLFTATSDTDGFDGVAARLEERFQGWLAAGTGLLAERQKLFGDRMRLIDDSMERLEMRLEIRERNLMRQFIALEEVMASLQMQAMWLEGQLQQLSAMSGAQSQRRR